MAVFIVPGTLCGADKSQIIFGSDFERACGADVLHPLTTGVSVELSMEQPDKDHQILAAIAYGESSTKNVFEEMAGIANAVVRQMQGNGYSSAAAFVRANPNYAYAADGSNQRYNRYANATMTDITKDAGMVLATRAAENALAASPVDYSNGAYFWDGIDIAVNANKGKPSERYKAGFRYTDPTHNIFNMKEHAIPKKSVYWLSAKGKKTSLRGEYEYTYESTAAHGGTIFWRYTQAWIDATGGKVWK